jgi:hypothetical protein
MALAALVLSTSRKDVCGARIANIAIMSMRNQADPERKRGSASNGQTVHQLQAVKSEGMSIGHAPSAGARFFLGGT